jgi:serine/threonine-protein kinase
MGLPPDPRDDVHALGVIWFQLLANDPKAFPDPESPARTREHLDRWGVPPPLAELLGACVAEDPARRPADGTVLAGRLGALLGRPTARPASTGAAETLPGYVVGEKLGRGDLAVVYKALQTGTGRTVAVKVFHAAEQFARREAEALAALDHPNIVRIHDSRTHNGRVYQVREFVEGASLHQAVRRHRPTVAAAAGLLARVATVVAHVHTHGIVHCDLTPGNILLARNPEQAAADPLAGTIKLAGFHLAVRPGRDPYPAGWVAGSPGYLSPEQALGQTDKIGPASDVWALAVILYELLTGTNPFAPRGGTRTFRETVFAEAPPPTRLRPDVPEELESLLIVCLRKDPARRIASAAELATELARFAGMSPAKPAARGWSLFGRRSR